MNIAEALGFGSEALRNGDIADPLRETNSLLQFAIARDRAFIIAHPEYELTVKEEELFRNSVTRRAAREPFQHIVGRPEFYGPDFLVPRDGPVAHPRAAGPRQEGDHRRPDREVLEIAHRLDAGQRVDVTVLGQVEQRLGPDFEVAGRPRPASTGDFVNGAFPQQLACVAVEVAGRRAPITYVQTDQVNFQVPAGTPSGSVPVTLILNPGRQNEVKGDVATVTVNNHSPAFFTFNGRSIAAQTSDFKTIADPAVVPGCVAARAG